MSSHWKCEMRYLFTKAVRGGSRVLFVRGEQAQRPEHGLRPNILKFF